MSLRNVGSGLGVLHGWRFAAVRLPRHRGGRNAPLTEFRRLAPRPLHPGVRRVGFLAGGVPGSRPNPTFAAAPRRHRPPGQAMTIELL